MSDITRIIFSIEDGEANDATRVEPANRTEAKRDSSLDLRPIVERSDLSLHVPTELDVDGDTDAENALEIPTIDDAEIDATPSPETVTPENPTDMWDLRPVDYVPSALPRPKAGGPTDIEIDEVGHGLTVVGVALGLLTALAIAAWTFGYFDMANGGQTLSPLSYAALLCAIFVPAIAVFVLFAALRALKRSRNESRRLSLIADRLLRLDENVEDEVRSLSGLIRAELSSVDTRLAQTQDGLETFRSRLKEQSVDIDSQTRAVAERSETIKQAMVLQRQAVETLSASTTDQIKSMADAIEARRAELDDTLSKASASVDESTARLTDMAKTVETKADHLRSQTESATQALQSSASALQSVANKSGEDADKLRAVYDAHSSQFTNLVSVLAEDEGELDAALKRQIERLELMENQFDRTEVRLNELLQQANTAQEGLTERLRDIERTILSAETQGQAFTRDMTDRISDVIAETRRDMALMETELRTLQARLSTDEPYQYDFTPEQAPKSAKTGSKSGRLRLKPLDTDFPPLDPPEDEQINRPAPSEPEDSPSLPLNAPIEAPDPIPVRPRAPSTSQEDKTASDRLSLTGFDDTPFGDPSENVSVPAQDLVRRPGQVGDHDSAARGFLPRKTSEEPKSGGWRWRDMLGRIDPLGDVETNNDRQTSSPQVQGSSAHHGDQPKQQTVPPQPSLPESSDIVARLCEIQLAPSAVVDDGTIFESTQALLHGGERVTDVVLRRLDEPVDHLRSRFTKDLEFRLRAETFTRHYSSAILNSRDEGEIRANLGSAGGRAFLLCAAALRD